MTLAQLREQVRRILDDEIEPHRWSDADLNAWIDEGQREAAKRSLALHGDESIAVTAGVPEYAVPARMLFATSVYLDGVKQSRTTDEYLALRFRDWRSVTGSRGVYLQRNRVIRLFGIPDRDGILLLSGPVLPSRLTLDSTPLEIDETEQPHLVHWVAFRAYSVRDEDTYDPNAAANHLALFEHIFGKPHTARLDAVIRDYGIGETIRSGRFL